MHTIFWRWRSNQPGFLNVEYRQRWGLRIESHGPTISETSSPIKWGFCVCKTRIFDELFYKSIKWSFILLEHLLITSSIWLQIPWWTHDDSNCFSNGRFVKFKMVWPLPACKYAWMWLILIRKKCSRCIHHMSRKIRINSFKLDELLNVQPYLACESINLVVLRCILKLPGTNTIKVRQSFAVALWICCLL